MSSLVLDGLALVAAILLAAIGGEAFLRGVLGFSAWLRLPKMLVATTLAAFATSSPELTVSSLAALAGKPEIGLGDALGSNVVNIALVLGIALMFGSLPARLEEIRRDMILALAVPPITFFLISDGVLSRADGAVLLCLFVFWLGMMVRQALHHRRRQAEEAPDAQGVKFWLISLYALLGLGSLLMAGKLFVSGASGIALAMGMSPYVIGATLVAYGTSLPELVTTLLSRWRGHDEIGLGTVLGSNLFNGLAIVGLAASIYPIAVPLSSVYLGLGVGVLSLLLILPRKGRISRRRGALLLALYAAFAAASLA